MTKEPENLEAIIGFLHNGPRKSKLEEIHLTYNLYDNYSGGSTMCDVGYGSLVGLRIDKLIDKYPQIQKVIFHMDIQLKWPDGLSHRKSLSGMHYKVVKNRVRSSILDVMAAGHSPVLPEMHIRVHD